jgi:hypothetical protein
MRLCAADAFWIPFSVLWGGFAIFWETDEPWAADILGEGNSSEIAAWRQAAECLVAHPTHLLRQHGVGY